MFGNDVSDNSRVGCIPLHLHLDVHLLIPVQEDPGPKKVFIKYIRHLNPHIIIHTCSLNVFIGPPLLFPPSALPLEASKIRHKQYLNTDITKGNLKGHSWSHGVALGLFVSCNSLAQCVCALASLKNHKTFLTLNSSSVTGKKYSKQSCSIKALVKI